MKALVTAGGRSTRMRPITYTINKHLIPLANRPMLEYVIEKLVEAEIREIFVNVNPGEMHAMRQVFGDGSRWNATLTYIEQHGGAQGIAHAVANAEPHLRGGPFVFFLGDNLMVGSIAGMKQRFASEQLDCMLALARVQDPNRFGVPEFHPDGTLKRAIEKPQHPPSPFAITGIYFFNEDYFDAFKTIQPSARGEYEISDMLTWYIEHKRVGYEEITGWWKDTGTPAALLEGNALLLDELATPKVDARTQIDPSARVEGKVSIGEGTVLGPHTLVRGPSIIGTQCVIDHAYIGPYTAIGNRVTLRHTEIEHSIVFDGARITSGKRIVDSIIGKDAVVMSEADSLPRGHKLLIGDQSTIEL